MVWPQQTGLVGDVNVGDGQGVKFVQSVGAAGGGGNIMVAYQQHSGDFGLRKAHHPFSPGTLEGGLRVAVFVSVSGKDNEVYLLGNGRFHNLIQCPQKIHHPQRQPRFRVMATIVGNINMGIGKMQYPQRFSCHSQFSISNSQFSVDQLCTFTQ